MKCVMARFTLQFAACVLLAHAGTIRVAAQDRQIDATPGVVPTVHEIINLLDRGRGWTNAFSMRMHFDLISDARTGLIAVLVSVPWPAGAYALPLQTPGDRADSLREASERLSRIHVENHLAISSYLRDSARIPDDELRRIEAQSARWLAQLRREINAGGGILPAREGTVEPSAVAVEVSRMSTAAEMQVFASLLSLRSGNSARAGDGLLTASKLMSGLGQTQSAYASGGAQGVARLIAGALKEPAMIAGCPPGQLVLLKERFGALPAVDPFGRLDAFRSEGREWMEWASACRADPEGAELLDRFGEFVQPALKGMTALTDGEFALASQRAEAFFDRVGEAVAAESPHEARAMLEQLRDEARTGMWGEFAVLMTDPRSFPDLADMRLRIDESEALVKGVIESLDEAIKANPGENAAVFYLEAAAIATEAENQGMPLSVSRETNYARDVRRLMQAGSECSWCDFSSAKDAAASIVPAYAPGLMLCIEFIADSLEKCPDDRPEERQVLALLAVRASRHLADDATLASAALSVRLLQIAVRGFGSLDQTTSGVEFAAVFREALNSVNRLDPFGWNRSVEALRMAFRTQWARRANVSPLIEWTTIGRFAHQSDPVIAWLGLLAIMLDADKAASLERLAALNVGEVELVTLQELLEEAVALIDRNDQEALSQLTWPAFDLLFASRSVRHETWMSADKIKKQMLDCQLLPE